MQTLDILGPSRFMKAKMCLITAMQHCFVFSFLHRKLAEFFYGKYAKLPTILFHSILQLSYCGFVFSFFL